MGIVVENLSYSYGEKRVLNNISLLIKSGENIGIIGESGCGKSTFLKLVSGLYVPCKGMIEVDREREPKEIRRKVAAVMQSSVLFPVSIRENITCGHEIAEETLEEACRIAQLTEWLNALPEGIDTQVGERGSKVSGGQAQRIAIARAIAKDAPVIILDEPTSALDEETSIAMMKAIKKLTYKKTVINVSHRKEALQDCNRVYTLTEGGLYLL